MHKMSIATIAAMLLVSGMAGCDREGGDVGEQMEKAAENTGDAVQGPAEATKKKLNQRTGQATDEEPQDKRRKEWTHQEGP
jgi:hypothetical protein